MQQFSFPFNPGFYQSDKRTSGRWAHLILPDSTHKHLYLIVPLQNADVYKRQDRAIEEFFQKSGNDNRVLIDTSNCPPGTRVKIYEASRKNFDRLVSEGKAIL